MRKTQKFVTALAATAVLGLMGGCSNPQKIETSKAQTEVSTEAESTAAEGAAQESSMAQETAQESTAASDQNGNSEEKRIVPLPATLSVNNLKDCTIEASFENSDIFMDGGALSIRMTVYDYEKFDMADISRMKQGDTLVINGANMPVDSLEEFGNGGIRINGGLEEAAVICGPKGTVFIRKC